MCATWASPALVSFLLILIFVIHKNMLGRWLIRLKAWPLSKTDFSYEINGFTMIDSYITKIWCLTRAKKQQSDEQKPTKNFLDVANLPNQWNYDENAIGFTYNGRAVWRKPHKNKSQMKGKKSINNLSVAGGRRRRDVEKGKVDHL